MTWEKYLTREYSFLFISFAAEVYKKFLRQYVIFHGQGKIITAYGTPEDTKRCYENINKAILSDPAEVLKRINHYPSLIEEIQNLCRKIKQTEIEAEVKDLFPVLLDRILEALDIYLFLVYAGYAGDKPKIKEFISEHRVIFEKARNLPFDTDLDEQFPSLINKINPKLKEFAHYISYQEVSDLLQRKKIDLNRAKERKKEYLIITRNGETTEYPLKDIQSVMTKEIEPTDSSKTELKGQLACQGIVHGPARIIFTRGDYLKIKEGDVLVTPMTKPNIVPFLSKVKGIVTNDGGVLCHASIISRELKIPCVVGTKHATDIFKNGDVIEVDANKGVVRKIK